MHKYDQYRDQFLKALSKSDWQNVVLNATELIKIDDTEPMVWTNRGVGLQSLGFPLDAVLCYDRSIALDPCAINFADKGAAYWDMGNGPEALKWLYKAIDADPTLSQAHFTMGNVYK